jgi:ADP-heptose:LPS heptosyltransferase
MPKLKSLKSLLIIRPDRIGDLTLSLAVPESIKAVCPNLRIEYLVSNYAGQVLKYSDYVDDWIYYTDENNKPKSTHELISLLNSKRYSGAVFLKPNWRSSFSAYLARIPIRIGTSRRAYSFLFNEKVNISRRGSNMHEIDLNLQLLKPLGLDIPERTLSPVLNIEGRAWPNKQSFELPLKYAMVHLGSKGSAANWPMTNYLRLINELGNDISVIITGQMTKLESLPVRAINLINRTDIDDLIHIIAGTSLFISGGTGPLHLASALRRPLIGLFPYRPHIGPNRWGPRTANSITITAPEQTGHRCRIKEDGSCDCTEAIDFDSVYGKARSLIK